MKKFALLAQKLFLTNRTIPQDSETRELISELLGYIIAQDEIIEEQAAQIKAAQIILQDPNRVKRPKR